MSKSVFAVALALASWNFQAVAEFPRYADGVVSYLPGTGYATDFGTGAGFTNALMALGEPSRITPGTFGGPIDAFNPPYLIDQVVSIGTGGSLTLSFSSPLHNDPANPFGLDFIVFGNAGFVITNGDFSGGGITDGSLFGANSGNTRVSVSADNVNYFTLDPSRAPVLDGAYPTDAAGRFDVPVDPRLRLSDFNGADLTAIRTLYQGSGGGTAFDLGWALDSNGQGVSLPEARFIRIDVLDGAAEIDGVAAIGFVPEPSTWALMGIGLFILGMKRVR